MSTSTTKRIVKLWNPAIDDDRPNVTTNSTISIANTDHLAKSTQQINNNNYAHLASIMMIMQQEQQPSLINQLTTISPPSNPIVKSIIINNQSSCINENCCAICGADFRLIGDLVHHMRTNHRSCNGGGGVNTNGRRTISINNRRRQSSTKMLINDKHRKCETNVVDNNHTDNRLLLLNAADFALKCPICSQKFDERNGLLLHIQTHNQL